MVPWPVEHTFEFGGAHQDVAITTSGHASTEGLISLATKSVAARSRAGMLDSRRSHAARQLRIVSC